MDLVKIGKFIAEVRKKKSLTQEQLAEKLGINSRTISRWENGKNMPDVSLYKDICEELGISIEELINGERDKSDVAKEKAIISVVKSKDKMRRKLKYVIIFFIILIFALIFFFYKNKEDELSKYYERNYQMTFVSRNVDAFFKYRYDGGYPEYYGGMYISDDAYNLIVQIVKDKIPEEGTIDLYYYNELFTVDKSIKIQYVKNSYNDLEKVYNKINEYLLSHEPLEDLNSVSIDILKNRIVVNYVLVNDEKIKEFKDKVVDSELVVFESALDNIDIEDKCVNYPDDIGTDILDSHGDALVSIHVGNKSYVPVSLTLYDDGTYELFTSYLTCKPGRVCTSILKYSKSVKGTYNYDIEKILKASTNANDKSYSMDNLPKYEIYLGEKYMKKYDSLMFTVEKGKKNKYLDEFLELINVDLSKCAKPEYK